MRGRLAAALLGAALAGAAPPAGAQPACPDQPATAATTTPEVRRGHAVRFRDRLAEIERQLATGRFDVVVLGDSLVQQWPAAQLDAAFPGRRVLNAGVPGDGAGALLFRLSGARTPAVVEGRRVEIGVAGWERQAPRDVLLLLGTNDLRRGPPCDVALGLLAVVARLRALWPEARVTVVSVLPRGEDQAELAAEIAAVNREMAARAAATRAFAFLDAAAALRCMPAAPCGVTRPPNHVHLTPAGYDRLAEAVRRGTAPAR